MSKPMPYQMEGIGRLEELNGIALLADEMGLGKTGQALWYAKKNNIGPILVVCPASLKINWQREAWKHTRMRCHILEGTKPPHYIPSIKPQVTIINYDVVGKWLSYLRRMKFQLIILDEIHYAKNAKAKRSKAVYKLCKGAPRCIELSGTPLVNNPHELWFPLRIIRPDLFPSFYSFAMRYCCPEKTFWGWKFSGARNLKELHTILKKEVMIRRRKKDVLDQLPPKIRHVVPMPISNLKEYQKAETDFINWLREKSPAKAHRARSAVKLTQMGYLIRLACKLKIRFVEEWVDNFLEETDEKIILLGRHVPPTLRLHNRYKAKSVALYGDVPMKERQIAVDRFNNDKRIRILVGNSPAWTGWNMTAASTVAFFEMAWTPGEHDQGESRPHRIGQTKHVSVFYLIAFGTIEEHLCKVIQKKQKILEAVLDGKRKATNLNIHDLVVEEMLKGEPP